MKVKALVHDELNHCDSLQKHSEHTECGIGTVDSSGFIRSDMSECLCVCFSGSFHVNRVFFVNVNTVPSFRLKN